MGTIGMVKTCRSDDIIDGDIWRSSNIIPDMTYFIDWLLVIIY